MDPSGIKSGLVIKAVKKRSALYDKSNNEYFSTTKHKRNLWIEVCREVCSEWDELSQHERLELRHTIIKRWKNLRTCFRRELTQQRKEHRNTSKGIPIKKKRKKYEYFDQMAFLLNPEVDGSIEIETDDEEVMNIEFEVPSRLEMENDDSDYDDPKVEIINENDDDYDEVESLTEATTKRDLPFVFEKSTSPVSKKNDKINNYVLDRLAEMKKDESDDDRQFILSLAPSFKKLNDRQKFKAKIGLLKVLQEVTFPTK